MHAFDIRRDWQTDGQRTDSFLIARPRLHAMQLGKKPLLLSMYYSREQKCLQRSFEVVGGLVLLTIILFKCVPSWRSAVRELMSAVSSLFVVWNASFCESASGRTELSTSSYVLIGYIEFSEIPRCHAVQVLVNNRQPAGTVWTSHDLAGSTGVDRHEKSHKTKDEFLRAGDNSRSGMREPLHLLSTSLWYTGKQYVAAVAYPYKWRKMRTHPVSRKYITFLVCNFSVIYA